MQGTQEVQSVCVCVLDGVRIATRGGCVCAGGLCAVYGDVHVCVCVYVWVGVYVCAYACCVLSVNGVRIAT